MEFDLAVLDSEAAVVDYDIAIHGYSYAATAPIVQLLLAPSGATSGYNDFKNVISRRRRPVAVDVSNVTSLTLENDEGTSIRRKAFTAFWGPAHQRLALYGWLR